MIKLNYFNCLKDNYLKNGLKLSQIQNKKYEKELKKVIINKSRPMMDWLDLPYQDKNTIAEIQLFGSKISRLYENFIVLGIGGSALGANAVKQALFNDVPAEGQKKKIKVTVVDNVDAEQFSKLLNKVNLKKTMFNVVTKSGTTVEILTMFSIVFQKLKQELGEDFFVNLVVTTEKDNVLWKFCQENKIKTYEVPKGVGGRYSVLCPVGLLPCAVMGVDLSKLLLGAKQVLENYKQQDGVNNLCYVSALINYNYIMMGKKEIALLPYSNRLSQMTDFYIQLLSESLGKEKSLSGKANRIFFTPTKAEGVTYQHSLLQMYQEGSKDRLFCFINLTKHNEDIKVPKFKNADLDKYLPTSMVTLMKQEQIGSSLAFKQAGHPSYEIIVPALNEENIGALLFYFELTTALMAEMMKVNAYDQQGVEMQKKYTKALIGVKGFEEAKQELTEMLQDKDKYEF